nr:hypothetical protein [Sicyoidochytrium minutum DNA virus]
MFFSVFLRIDRTIEYDA